MITIDIENSSFTSSDRSLSIDSENYIKSNRGIYYNCDDSISYLLDQLVDNLFNSRTPSAIIFIQRNSIILAFANNKKAKEASVIEFKVHKQSKQKDINKALVLIKHYLLLFTSDKILHIYRLSKTGLSELEDLLVEYGIKFEEIPKQNMRLALEKTTYPYSRKQKLFRSSISITLVLTSVLVGIILNNFTNSYFEGYKDKIQSDRTLKNNLIKKQKVLKIDIGALEKTKKENIVKKEIHTKIFIKQNKTKLQNDFIIKDFKIIQGTSK